MIRIAGFAGEIPRLIPRLLQDNYAQHAANLKLENGALIPIRQNKPVFTMPYDCKSIFKRGDGVWLGWNKVVNVEPGPVADDRLYITGDGAPKILVGSNQYGLAVPRPLNKPSAVVDGVVDDLLSSTVLFAYTWVTAFDEESEPSDLSEGVLWSSGLSITVSGFDTPPSNRAIERMRIYRSQTSSLGETELYFIAERSASDLDFTYTEAEYPMNEVIASKNYHAPPNKLEGLISMPNGMMVGFVGKKVYFSEPYRPHAWPEMYVMTVDYPIIGLGAFGSSLAVLTTGMPYLMQGTSPDTMVSQRLDVNLPCLSAHSIVDLGYSVAYASTQGLVTISQNGAMVASGSLLTTDQWKNLKPETFIASQYAGRYIACYDYLDGLGRRQQGMYQFDLSGEQPFLTRVSDRAEAMFFEIGSGRLYLLQSKRSILEWDALDQKFLSFKWRSKRFIMPSYTNFGCIMVEGEVPEPYTTGIVQDNRIIEISVYADSELVFTGHHLNVPIPLPSGFTAKQWEIQVESNQMITGIILAYTPTEMAEG